MIKSGSIAAWDVFHGDKVDIDVVTMGLLNSAARRFVDGYKTLSMNILCDDYSTNNTNLQTPNDDDNEDEMK